MFTGIIEEVGIVKKIERNAISSRLTIIANKVLKDTKIGDSICTSGVCLTVTAIGSHVFTVDIMAETLRMSKLGTYQTGSKVNLERALCLNKQLGGHIVSGHIDGIGRISSLKAEDNAVWVSVTASPEILRYIIEKGSITIDGISLTVANLGRTSFQVSIIPHTQGETTLLMQKPGDAVNLECDIIGKYVERLLKFTPVNQQKHTPLSADYLAENGFI